MSVNSVLQFYRTVIDDVVSSMRENFLDDGVDEQVLVELKQIWENKLTQSKAVPAETTRLEPEKTTSHSRRGEASQAAQAAQAAAVAAAAAAAAAATTVTSVAATQSAATAAAAVSQPTVQYHYTTAAGQSLGADKQKPMTFTLPQGMTMAPGQTFTLPAHLMQHASNSGSLVMSTSAAAAAQALPAGMTAGLLQSAMTINASGLITQQQGDRTVSYQTVTAEQLAKQGYMVSMAPGVTAQALQTAGATGGHHLHPVQVTSKADNGGPKMVHFLSGGKSGGMVQLDGANDTTDEDDDDDDFKDDDLDEDEANEEEEVVGEEEDPLNSEDDVSDDDPSELFDTDNVIVCQYDKITRSRNKWKFHLKDGIMNVQGKDYVFQKACGDAEW